ncbi:MAG: hypothetical protein IPN94_00170 [Sphingobacteriales bacterium]|nr:hypothetical protein [Sphingobacteriales bacterium]
MLKILFIDDTKNNGGYRYEILKQQLKDLLPTLTAITVEFTHDFQYPIEKNENGDINVESPQLANYDAVFLHNSYEGTDYKLPATIISMLENKYDNKLYLYSGSLSIPNIYHRSDVYSTNFRIFINWANDKGEFKKNILQHGNRHLNIDIRNLEKDIRSILKHDIDNWQNNIPKSEINKLLALAQYTIEQQDEWWQEVNDIDMLPDFLDMVNNICNHAKSLY